MSYFHKNDHISQHHTTPECKEVLRNVYTLMFSFLQHHEVWRPRAAVFYIMRMAHMRQLFTPTPSSIDGVSRDYQDRKNNDRRGNLSESILIA